MAHFLTYFAILLGLSHPPDMVSKATYYHDYYHGRLTRNEEMFDQEKLTAAVDDGMWHKLKGKEVIVCESSKEEGYVACRCVVVRANDTGYLAEHGVILDLSKRAFQQLAPLRQGVVPVKVWVMQ